MGFTKRIDNKISERERSEAGCINDEADKKEAVSLAEPVLLHRRRSNEAINRLFELRIACKCLLLVTFDAYYAKEFILKKKDSSVFNFLANFANLYTFHSILLHLKF